MKHLVSQSAAIITVTPPREKITCCLSWHCPLDDKPLKTYYENLLTVIWLILAEISYQAERVNIIITNEKRTEEYCYVFDPDNKK